MWTSYVQFLGEDGTEAIRAHVGVDVLKGGLCALVGNLDTLLDAIVVIDPSQSKVSFFASSEILFLAYRGSDMSINSFNITTFSLSSASAVYYLDFRTWVQNKKRARPASFVSI